MKITKVTPILVNRFLYVEVETDEGIKGVGESGAWGFLETSYAAVNEISRCLIGQDASRIQFLWNYMYRMFHFRGAAIMGALSAIVLLCGILLESIMECRFISCLAEKCP